MNFEFATAGRVVFGAGKRAEALAAAKALGARGLLVTGADPARAEWARNTAGLDFEVVSVAGEPAIGTAERGAAVARSFRAKFVLAVGGGSVIDAGKAMAALATNTLPALEYLEVIGAGSPLTETPLPFIAVPTTAGTGSEATRNAVLASPEHRVKASLRSAGMLAAVAVVDPELTLGLPPSLTASTGMDALTQLIEPFLCLRANPMTDALCREAIPKAAQALPRAFANGQDMEARTAMALASLFGGVALANAGLGAVHGFAAPIGGMFQAPHGTVCAALLPHVLAMNLAALRSRAPRSPVLDRFAELARMLTGRSGAVAEDAVNHLQNLSLQLEIPRLGGFGIAAADFREVSSRAARASSMKANPITLTDSELEEVLARAV